MQYWEDLREGQRFLSHSITLTAADIIDYASDFDPQPYHLDPQVAESSIFGGHCASGWQVCALMMRMLVDTMNQQRIQSIGSSGVSSLRWLKPVFANDSLTASITIEQQRKSSESSDFGLIDCAIDVKNQHDISVVVLSTEVMIEKRADGLRVEGLPE